MPWWDDGRTALSELAHREFKELTTAGLAADSDMELRRQRHCCLPAGDGDAEYEREIQLVHQKWIAQSEGAAGSSFSSLNGTRDDLLGHVFLAREVSVLKDRQ